MKINNFNENQLLKDLYNNNREAYKHIYVTFYSDLCRYICNFTDVQTAEDIVQNVLLEFWEKRRRLEIQLSLKSYLYKAVYYKFLDSVKKSKRINQRLEEIRYTMVDQVENENDSNDEVLSILRNTISELPPRCQQIFLMSKYQGMKYKEIAQELNITVSTVESQIGKAFKIIREKFSHEGYLNLFLLFFNKKRIFGWLS